MINGWIKGVYIFIVVIDMMMKIGCFFVIFGIYKYDVDFCVLEKVGECNFIDVESFFRLVDKMYLENVFY